MLAPLPAAALAATQVDPGTATPGIAGFLVFAALAVALLFIGRSMYRHLRSGDERETQRTAGGRTAPAPRQDRDPPG